MKGVERLEAIGDGRLDVVVAGEVYALPHPTQLSSQEIAEIYHTEGATLFAPTTPGMTLKKARGAFEHWRAWHDLPTPVELGHLFWMVDRYDAAIEADMMRDGLDLAELWRARRWRQVKVYLDTQPLASHTQAALHTDPEYAEMVVKAKKEAKARGEKEPESGGPSLTDWTLEAEYGAKQIDVLERLVSVLIAANSSKKGGSKPPPIEPRPRTAHKDAKETSRYDTHRRLSGKLLSSAEPVGSDE